MNHKWQQINSLERKCLKCGAKSSKNFARDTSWSMPWFKGEPKLKCKQDISKGGK